MQPPKLIFTRAQIENVAARLQERITWAYGQDLDGVTFVVLLDGAKRFADLLLPKHAKRVDVAVSSYVGDRSTGQLRVEGELHPADIWSRDVVIVDDIIDTGLTLHKMKEKLTEMGATDVVAVCMLRRHLETPRWVRFGLTLPESCGFVAGMGLDYNHKHRDLDGIYEMK